MNTQLIAKKTLSRQLLLPVVISFIILVIFITSLVFNEMSNSLEASIQKQLTATATLKTTKIETLFKQYILNTAAWSKLEIMDDIITEDVDGRIGRTLQELKKSYLLDGDIFIFSAQHKLMAASNNNFLLKKEVDSFNWKQSMNNNVRFIDKHSDPYTDLDSIAFTHTIVASFDQKTVIGMIVVTHPWQNIEDLMSTPSHYGVLTTISGLPLASNLTANTEFQSFEPSKADIKINEISYLMGISQIKNVINLPVNWRVITLEERENALLPVKRLGISIVAFSLVLTVIMIWLIVIFTRRVLSPIQEVTHTVLNITQSSDLSKRVQIESQNELGILAESFNTMTAKLASSMADKDLYADKLSLLNETLEQQVIARTEDFRLSNEELTKIIEQLKMAQTQLVQSEKMASLGQLVAGIAHEINNPLGSINANIPMLVEYTEDLFQLIDSVDNKLIGSEKLDEIDYTFIVQDTPELLSSMKNAANRMKEIVLSLRNFSRLDQAEIQNILIEDALNTTLALLTHQFKNRITITKHYHLKQTVACYAGLINQVLMNLLANAIQAIENEGEIIVETRLDVDTAVISIKDSGSGMSQAIQEKIFDPFFTTKPVGEGTGMGLSISYGIIEKHDGTIQVISELGKGTEFLIRLPLNFDSKKDIT